MKSLAEPSDKNVNEGIYTPQALIRDSTGQTAVFKDHLADLQDITEIQKKYSVPAGFKQQ